MYTCYLPLYKREDTGGFYMAEYLSTAPFVKGGGVNAIIALTGSATSIRAVIPLLFAIGRLHPRLRNS
jgi:hypothetical protein